MNKFQFYIHLQDGFKEIRTISTITLTRNHIITPDSEANSNVITSIGHDPAKDPIKGLFSGGIFFTKNATPGDSTESTTK